MNDATYPDLARSLLEQGSYQIRMLPQTTFPPGFTLILAAVGLFFGITPATMFPVMAISATLGLISAYVFLRRVEGRAVAACVCLLLASSPEWFGFSTTVVYPEMPYFLMSMLALLLALKIDHTERGGALIAWIVLLSAALVLTVMIRSVGVALLAGLGTWIAMSLLIVPKLGRRRLRKFVIPLVLGLVAQVSWSIWAQRHEILEWQLPGYPQSYISQLRVKDGHYPELGMASLKDIPGRVGRNTLMRSAGFSRLLSGRNISKFWSSPGIFGALLLVIVGAVSSLRNGGQLHDWYFLWYEFIFIVWPWKYGDRFLLPIMPLACLYLWRGAKTLWNYSLREPRAAGLNLGLLGALLCVSSAAFALGLMKFPTTPEHVRGDHLQPIAATFFWGLSAVIGFGMLKSHSPSRHNENSNRFARLSQIAESRIPLAFRVAAISIIALMVLSGSAQVVASGRHNLSPDITRQSGYPMIEAARWIQSNEPSNRVIMARDSEFIFHFTYRRVVWFPPISDPKVLMDGIRRHHVGIVLVVHHTENYWLPAEDDCFQALQKAYPNAFHLAHRGLDTWVYEVESPPERTLGAF